MAKFDNIPVDKSLSSTCRERGPSRRLRGALLGSVTFLSLASPAGAVDWTGATSSDWNTSGNWSTNAVPTNADTVIIDTTSPNATILSGGSGAAASLTVGNNSAATFTVNNSGTFTAADVAIGQAGVSTGSISVTGIGSSFTSSHDFFVGVNGAGTVVVSDGAALTNYTTNIASLSGGSGGAGTLTVTGPGALWTNTDGVNIARDPGSTGALNITNGATAQITGTGIYTGAGAAINISGANTSATVLTGWLSPAGGTVNVSDGAYLYTYGGYIGPGSTTGLTEMTVTGPGTVWESTVRIYVGGQSGGTGVVGGAGNGLLTVSNGATLTTATFGLGMDSAPLAGGDPSTGRLILSGSGSSVSAIANPTLSALGNIYAGYAGSGTAIVSDGALLHADNQLRLAWDVGSTGTVIIGAAPGQAPVAPGVIEATNGVAFGEGTSRLVFNHNSAGYVFSSKIIDEPGVTVGPSSVEFLAGRTILTNANTYTGPTTVTNSQLVVTGSIVSPTSVYYGGVLSGTGSVGSTTLFNGATLAPGAPGPIGGPLTVNGNLTFNPGATLATRINGVISDRAIVTGSAALGGGSVVVGGTAGPNAYLLPRMTYTLLSAQGGVSGAFSNVRSTFASLFMTPSLTYDANNVYLKFNVAPFGVAASNGNQLAVANGLTAAFSSGLVTPAGGQIISTLISSASPLQAQAVYDATSGAGLAGVQSAAMQTGSVASATLSDQAAFWRSGETDGPMSRVSHEGEFLAYAPQEKYQGPIQLKDPPAANVAQRRWRAWGTFFGGGGSFATNAGRGAPSMNNSWYGGLIGADYQIAPNWLIGAAVGGSSSAFNVGALQTSGNLTGFHAGLYTSATFGRSYIELSETFSTYSNQTNRNAGGIGYIPYETLQANFNSREFRTRAEFGHTLDVADLKATPFAAAEFAAFTSDRFREYGNNPAGALALANNGQSTSSIPTFLGLRLSNTLTLANGWKLSPRGSVAWVHEFMPQRNFTNILISMPGSDFTVAGPRGTYNLVQARLGGQIELTRQTALYADFTGEYSGVQQTYGGKAGLKYEW